MTRNQRKEESNEAKSQTIVLAFSRECSYFLCEGSQERGRGHRSRGDGSLMDHGSWISHVGQNVLDRGIWV